MNFSPKRFNLLFFSLSGFSILFGGVIYVLLRPTEPAFFEWFEIISIRSWISLIRETTVSFSEYFPEWFVYSLPNGLWAFSFTLIIFTIWGKTDSAIKYLWYATIPVLIFGFEYLQYLGVIKGTFSIKDLISGLAGIIAGVLIGILKPKL